MAGITVRYEVLNQLNTPTLYAAPLADQPAPAIVGRIFFRTDSPFGIYRDTGTSWNLVASPDTTGITGTLAAGQVPYATGTTTVGGTNNLFWDSANNRLGIGTTTPGVPLDVHGTGTQMQLNGTGTNNSFLVFQNAGVGEWRIGNNYSGATNYFSIFDQSNSVEGFKLESGATNILTLNANTTFTKTFLLSVNQNANTDLAASNTTAGTASRCSMTVTSDGGGFLRIQKVSSGYTSGSLNLFTGNDTLLANNVTGNLVIYNQVATGVIRFTSGGLNAAHMTLTASGRLLIGTTTEGTEILKVNGTSLFQNTVNISDAINIALQTTTGTKIGTANTQKIGFWNATPIVQPTTATAAAAFVVNAGTAINTLSTFDGYTIGSVIKALRNAGLLA